MPRLPAWRRLGASRSGSVGSITAVVLAAMLSMVAVVIDGSQLYLLRRRQQGMTDLAAVAAASRLDQAAAAAQASLAANRIPADQLQAVDLGIYVANASVPAPRRFVVSDLPAANAVRVTVRSQASTFLGAFVGQGTVPITTSALAANLAVGSLSANPPLAGIDPAIANGVLGSLIGATLTLTTADYLGLGSATVDGFAFADSFAARTGFTGTYGDLMGQSVRLSDAYWALADVLARGGAQPIAVSAVRVVALATSLVGPRFRFGNLIAFEAMAARRVRSGDPGLGARLPVLPFILAAARLGAATLGNAVASTATNLLSGLPEARIVLATNLPPALSSFAVIGPAGASVRTLETRASVSLDLPLSPPLPRTGLTLYLQSQAATVRIDSIAAARNAVTPYALAVTPGLSTIWVGSVPDAALANWAATPQPAPARIIDVPLVLRVTGSAQIATGTLAETMIYVSAGDVSACRMRVATGNGLLVLVTSLLGSLNLQVALLGFGFGTQSALVSAVTAALAAQTQPIVATLDSTLSFLGLTLGNVGTWSCSPSLGQVALVN